MKKAEQSESTRRALLQAARELFTERGYADTATEDIAQRAGVTRGALYYQFRDKAGLFRAVVEDLNLNISTRIVSAMQANQGEETGDPWDRLVNAGREVYLDACLDPAFQRIALIEASSVLGWEEKRAVEGKYGLSIIRGMIQALLEARLIAPQPVEPLAHLIFSAITDAAMYIARADDIPAMRKEMSASLERLFRGLRMKN